MGQMDSVIVQPIGTPLIKIMQEQLGKPNIAIFNHVKSINCPFHLIGMTVDGWTKSILFKNKSEIKRRIVLIQARRKRGGHGGACAHPLFGR